VSYAANTYNLNSYIHNFNVIDDETTTSSYDKYHLKSSKKINTKFKTKSKKFGEDDFHLNYPNTNTKRKTFQKLIKSIPKYRKIRRKERAIVDEPYPKEDILLPPLEHTKAALNVHKIDDDDNDDDDNDEIEQPKNKKKQPKSFAIKSSTIKTSLTLDSSSSINRNDDEKFSKSSVTAEELNKNKKNNDDDDDDDDDRKINFNFAGRNNNKTNLVVKQQQQQQHTAELKHHHEHGLQTEHYLDKTNNQINEINSDIKTTTITGTTNQDNKELNSNSNNYNISNANLMLNLDNEDSIIIGDQQLIIITGDGEVAAKMNAEAVRRRTVRHKDEEFFEEPLALPLRPLSRGPYEEEQRGDHVVVYGEQHTATRLNCEVDLDINSSIWMKDGQVS
jgi:hypothetical protein